MKHARYGRLLQASCMLALFAFALMISSVLDPRPIPVILAMSLGQVLCTLSLAAFLGVVVADIRGQVSKVSKPE